MFHEQHFSPLGLNGNVLGSSMLTAVKYYKEFVPLLSTRQMVLPLPLSIALNRHFFSWLYAEYLDEADYSFGLHG